MINSRHRTAVNTLPLFGRRIQVAGSASGKIEPRLVAYAHKIVSGAVKLIMEAGGGIIAGVGREPRVEGAPVDTPSLVFDWSVLDAAAKCLRSGCCDWPTEFGHPIVLVTSEKSQSEIPQDRRTLFDELLQSGRVRVESIMPGSRAATLLRQRQAAFGDMLLVVGGGTGVEHSADLYMARRKAIIPLDLDIGSSRDDGTGGGFRLARLSRAEPNRFIRFNPSFAGAEGTSLAAIATRNGDAPAAVVANGLLDILKKIAKPVAFYVRLLAPTHEKFTEVESFFRDVVDPVVEEAGMHRIEVGTNKSEHAFMNVAIFESLHFAAVAIVDVTGERPNCFIELGYALGNGNRVLVTALEGTVLPFDQKMIPCHFWKTTDTVADRKKALIDFWEKQVDRPSIMQSP